MAQRIQWRRDSADTWNTVNPILAFGEAGLGYIGTALDSLRIGDGQTHWVDLPTRLGLPGGYTKVTDDATPPDMPDGTWWLHP